MRCSRKEADSLFYRAVQCSIMLQLVSGRLRTEENVKNDIDELDQDYFRNLILSMPDRVDTLQRNWDGITKHCINLYWLSRVNL